MMRLRLLTLAAQFLHAQIAIVDVTVIDPRARSVVPGQTVLVDEGRIMGAGPASEVKFAARYRTVDGRRRFLIPGLWDNHVHLTKAGETSLALFLANGVTSVRDMGSDPDEVLRWRAEIEAGKRAGPRIRTSGRILESKANVVRMKSEGGVEPVDRIRIGAGTPEEARKAVEFLAGLHVDHIKIRTVASPEVFDAIADAARRASLPLAGHAFGRPEDYIGRMKSVEHSPAFPPLDNLTRDQRAALFGRMRDQGTWMSTTVVNLDGSVLIPYDQASRMMQTKESRDARSDPRRRYIGGYLLTDWREQVEEKKDAESGALRKIVPGLWRDLVEVREAGVKFLPGTDVAVAFIYPGFSLHDELQIYVARLGFTPMEALRAATHNPAEFYGIEAKQGGIAPGQAADLLLLDASPLDDIANTKKIRAVAAGGRLWTRRQLDDLLAATARDVARLK
ncbi:MAG: amidohydrolase family protein [Bryobacteraceae bacterium]